MTDIVNEEWYQFLRELVWPIVVGAVGYEGRHNVGIMKSPNKMV